MKIHPTLKRIFAIFWVTLLCALLIFNMTSCTSATEKTDIVITNIDGAGTRSIYVSFPTDDSDNAHYFPKGMEAAADFLSGYIDESFKISYSKSGRQHVFYLSFSFNNLEEHISKLKLLIGQERWEMLEPENPQIVFSESSTDGKMVATYFEPYCISHACTSWAYEVLINDGVNAGVFDIDGHNTDTATLDNMYKAEDSVINITFLGNTESYTLGDTELYSSAEVTDDGSRSQLILKEATASLSPPEGQFQSINPSTQKAIIYLIMTLVGLIITLICVIAFLIVLRKRKIKFTAGRTSVIAQTEFLSTGRNVPED